MKTILIYQKWDELYNYEALVTNQDGDESQYTDYDGAWSMVAHYQRLYRDGRIKVVTEYPEKTDTITYSFAMVIEESKTYPKKVEK